MASSSQTHEIWALRSLVNKEISKGIEHNKQSAATQMSLLDTVSAIVLGLDVQILTQYCCEEMRRGMIELAKTMPVLLTYTAGKERQEASQAIWQLHKRAKGGLTPMIRSFYEQPTLIKEHFLMTKVKEMPIGPRGYAKVDYISCDVVPLVDYWPDFVCKAFALGCWRFAIGDAKGGNGVVLEIMEGRLDLIEWLIEMEEKRELAVNDPAAGPEDRRQGGIWPIASTCSGHEQIDSKEKSKEHGLMEAAQMMKVLEI